MHKWRRGPLFIVVLAACWGLCAGAALGSSTPFTPERFQSGAGVAEVAAAEVVARLLEGESIQITHNGAQRRIIEGNTKRSSQSRTHASDQHAWAKTGKRPAIVRSVGGSVQSPKASSSSNIVDDMEGDAILEKSESINGKKHAWDIAGTTDGSHGTELVLFSDLAASAGNGSRSADSSPEDKDDDDYDDGIEEDEGDMILAPLVNITAEQDATVKANAEPLKVANLSHLKASADEPDMMKLGDGIGTMAYVQPPAGTRQLNRELRRRLQLQDAVTVLILLTTFLLTILVSAWSIYQVADDPSPALFYSDPQPWQQRLISESSEPTAFLSAFSRTPQNCRLRIVGRHREELEGFSAFHNWHARSLAGRGLQGTMAALLPVRPRRRRFPFDVALDLTPFITSSGRLSDDNMEMLNKYIDASNPLQRLLLQKRVDWPNWEDVATNIRQRLKALGFLGDVDVYLEAHDEVLIYRNHKWANFVRNSATQALIVISIIGGIFWLPYLRARVRTIKVEARFQVNLEPARYWDLVSDGLNAAGGFQA